MLNWRNDVSELWVAYEERLKNNNLNNEKFGNVAAEFKKNV
jgi:hypothetical protein